MRYKITFLSLVIISFFTGYKVSGRIITVPGDYPTIQAGINAAANKDTVLVDNGTYYENINYRGKNIVVSSKYILSGDIQDILNTIIDGSHSTQIDTGSCVLMINGEDSTAVIEGFTLTNGTGTSHLNRNNKRWREGGAIILDNSNAVIKNNLIINNQSKVVSGVIGAGGGGISIMYGRPRILNNVVMNNSAGYAGGIVLNWSGGLVRNNIIYENFAGSSYGGGGVMVWSSPYLAIIENNTIVGNITVLDGDGGGGILINNTPGTIVRNNLIWGNRQRNGKQIAGAGMFFNNNTEETFTGTEMISVFPEFDNIKLMLKTTSAGVDAGISTSEFNDKENTLNPGYALLPSKGTIRNDIGAYGGSFVTDLPVVMNEKIYVSSVFNFGTVTVPATKKIELGIANFGLAAMTLDSVVLGKDMSAFTLNKNLNGKVFQPFEKDTLKLNWVPVANDTIKDTVLIYHKCSTLPNPHKVAVNGISKIVTAINKLNESNVIKVYPNPCRTSVNFESNSNDEIIEITLLNASGRKMQPVYLAKNKGINLFNFNTTRLKPGVYFVKIRSNKSERTEKLIKI